MIRQSLKNKGRYLDFHRIIKQILKYWYLFIAGLFIGLAGVMAFNKMAIPKFRASAKIIIFIDDKTVRPNPYDYFKGLRLFSPTRNLRNEILFLKSTPIMIDVIEKLDLTVTYFAKSKRQYQEIYDECPFKIYYDNKNTQVVNVPFYVSFINDTVYRISIEQKNAQLYDFLKEYPTGKTTDIYTNGVYKIGDVVKNDNYSFSLLLKDGVNPKHLKGKEYAFQINGIQSLADDMKKNFSAGRDPDGGSVVNISFKSESLNKAFEVLSVIAELYLESRTNRMTELVSISLNYIDRELKIINDSLTNAEWRMQDLRRRYNLRDVETKTMNLYGEHEELENQLALLKIQQNFYNYTLNYLETKKLTDSDISIPSFPDINDEVLSSQIREFTTLFSEKNVMETKGMTKSPYYKKIITSLTYSIHNIKESINNLSRANQIAIKQIEERIAEISKSLYNLPNMQRQYINIARKYQVNEHIYNYLHEKRSEAIIAKTGKLPKVEIVEYPKASGKAFPHDFINYIAGIFLGIYIPGLIVWLRTRFGKKIETENELTSVCRLPVVGKVPLTDAYISNRAYPYYYVEEAIKSIRASLDYFMQGEKSKIIALTSSCSGDGKTFLTTQIAKSFCELNLQVLIIGFDLRNPTLQEEFNMKSILGISEYLINKANIDDIIQPSGIPNLDIIFPGEHPPNASDLLASDKVEGLLNLLKDKYHYIFLDTAPMGLVPDAKPLLNIADFNFIVVRLRHTQKALLYETIEEIEEKYPSNSLIVFNGLNGLEDKLFSNPFVSIRRILRRIREKVIPKKVTYV